MALRTPRTDLHPPAISRTFTLPVGGSTVVADSAEPVNTVSPAGAPAAGINHLPSSLFLAVTTAGTFVWKDELGNTGTISCPVGMAALPFSLASIEIGTAIGSLACSWHPEA